jgi:hypothetical protein
MLKRPTIPSGAYLRRKTAIAAKIVQSPRQSIDRFANLDCSGHYRYFQQLLFCKPITQLYLSSPRHQFFHSWLLPLNHAKLASTSPAMSTICSYHSSAVSLLEVRRRRRSNVGDNVNESTNDESEVLQQQQREPVQIKIDPSVFVSHATTLLNKLHDALVPLLKINDNMTVRRGDSIGKMERQPQQNHETLDGSGDSAKPVGLDDEVNEFNNVDGPYLLIDLGPVDGQYTLIADEQRCVILFQSPISGQLLYNYNETTGNWCNVYDQHNLEGIFVRDLIRQIRGVPNL